MKSKSAVLLTLAIFISSSNLMSSQSDQGAGDAYFTSVEYPKSKIYQASEREWVFTLKFTVYNANCSVDTWGRAWFFFKIYQNGELWWDEYKNTTYGTWQCNRSSMVQRSLLERIPVWTGPKTYNFKIELYWDYEGVPYLQDTTALTITLAWFMYISRSSTFQLTALSYLFFYSFITLMLAFHSLITGPLKIPREEENTESTRVANSTSCVCANDRH